MALGGNGQGRLQGGHLLRPSYESRQAAGARHLEGGSQRTDALQDADAEWLTGPLDGKGPEVAQVEVALDQPGGVLGEVGPSRFGQRLHALGEPHGVPHGGVLHVSVVTDGTDDDLSRVEADADVEN